MKRVLAAAVLFSLAALPLACQQQAGSAGSIAAADIETTEQKAAYAIGLNLGNTLRQQGGTDLDAEIIAQGLRDGLAESEPLLTVEEMETAIAEMNDLLMARARDLAAEAGATNRTEAEAFFAENGQREGVMTTASGLQYEVITMGDGPSPSATDTVSVHYRGTLLDGTEFDSSAGSDPVTFPLNQVISGWTEGLQLMNVGSTFMFWLPSELAYGSNPPGPPIGPDAALIFEVELLGIEGR
jgi:FKBP-type peptidyl-prolyl cis-trans isomerase